MKLKIKLDRDCDQRWSHCMFEINEGTASFPSSYTRHQKIQNRRMASNSSTIRLLCLCYFVLSSFMFSSNCSVISLINHAGPCNGSIAECNQEDELLMESEISRRFLEQKRYISNGALQRDRPVCNGGGSGEAYSKTGGCLPPPSNPHTRGCSKYYRCRSDS